MLEPLTARPKRRDAQITTTPAGLDVIIDGQALAEKSPIKTTLKVGPHTIVVKQNGVEVWHQTIDAEPQSEYEFNPSFTADKLRERAERAKSPTPHVAPEAPAPAPAPAPSDPVKPAPTTPEPAKDTKPPAPATPAAKPTAQPPVTSLAGSASTRPARSAASRWCPSSIVASPRICRTRSRAGATRRTRRRRRKRRVLRRDVQGEVTR